jgi:MoaA/NifB/PqqE/SkfB family radical SAM enzyme
MIKARLGDLKEKPLPIKLTIALTFLCNSRCKTCNIWRIYKKNYEKFYDELTYTDWIKLFDEIGDNLIWIEFTGGEITLKKDVEKIISYAYNNTSITIGGLNTNAVLPKRGLEVIKSILTNIPKEKTLVVGISLDGGPELHYKIRGIKENFKRALWLFKELKKLGKKYKNLIVHFSYTVSEYNAGNFKSFYNFLKERYGINIDDITITLEHFVSYYNRSYEFKENPYKKFRNGIIKDVRDYLDLSRKDGKKHKNIIDKIKSYFYKFYVKNIPTFIDNPKKMIIPCSAGTGSAYINPYGDVHPCISLDIKLGNLKKNTFKEIWWGGCAKLTRKQIKRGECPNCWTACEAEPSWVYNFGFIKGWV